MARALDSLTTVSILESWSDKTFFIIPSLLSISSWRTLTPSHIESILLSKATISFANNPDVLSAFNLDSTKSFL